MDWAFNRLLPFTPRAIVRFMSLCKRIFGDIIFTSCPIKFKLISIIERL